MAFFGKPAQLSALLKKLQTKDSFASGELDALLDQISEQPEFSIEECSWLLMFPNRRIRAWAGDLTRACRSVELADQLLRQLPDQKDSEIREELARVIVRMAPKKVVPYLGRMIHAKKPELRIAALELIEQYDHCQEFIGYLKAALRDPEPRLRHRAVRILAKDVRDSTVFLILRGLINDEDVKVRHIVIECLARDPQPEVIDPFFERLTDEDDQTRTLILRALHRLASTSQAKIESHLLPILADEETSMRDFAVKLLKGMPDPTRMLRSFLVYCKSLAYWLRERSMESISKVSDDLVPTLIALMQDEDIDIRVGALVMVGRSRDRRILPQVEKIFLLDADWWIQSLAADILGNFPEVKVTETLLSRLEDPELRFSVVFVLGRHDNDLARKALLGCFADPDRGLRMAALEALEGSKEPTVLEAINRMASDPDSMVRQKAADILHHKGMAGSVPAVAPEAPTAQDGELEMVNEMLNVAAPDSLARSSGLMNNPG